MRNERLDLMGYALTARNIFVQKLKGKPLTHIAREYNLTRRWYEKIPLVGDYFFRRRIMRSLREV